MAQIFLQMGYEVDIIRYTNDTFLPTKEYRLFIDVSKNMERISPHLNKDCTKIFLIVFSHWLTHNTAQLNRLAHIVERRKVAIPPSRLIEPNAAIEHADAAVVFGNQFTIDSYKFADKPIFRLPISSQVTYPWPKDKDFASVSRNFLWLGSSGLVHKGLDLVLEAFAEMPEYNLTICGPVENDKAFNKCYYRELYELPNIHPVGWIDLTSDKFVELAKNCLGLVYPSSSEAGGGCIINCWHAAIIPIVSYEASVDVYDFGITLEESSVKEIQDKVVQLSETKPEILEEMARKGWAHANQHYTRETFSEAFRKFANKILKSSDWRSL
jgi:glycosyltransferase involved in cell wall biosynthesis